jgi:gamma-glutamyltranspeptidase/glutathione hydrolase
VYFSVVDAEGNGCSFINSNFMGFGTGIVPGGCGFSIQNRGRGFVLDQRHPNEIAPRKRPYHTIIPGMITEIDDGSLASVFGIMGGMMQPQAHLQVAAAMIEDRADPQSALDAPRFQLSDGMPDGVVLVEDSMPASAVDSLRSRGHEVAAETGPRRSIFGLGQVIARSGDAWWCGSDPRGDGHAAGF